MSSRLQDPLITPSVEAATEFEGLADLFARSRREWYALGGGPRPWQPVSGSYASWEHERALLEHGPAGPWGEQEAGLPLHVATIFGLAAAEHLGGLAALYRAHEVVFPVGPVVRSIVEHATRGTWLLDNEILPADEQEAVPRRRVARAWLELIEGTHQSQNTAAAFRAKGSHLWAKDFEDAKRDTREKFHPSEIVESKKSVTKLADEERLNAAKVLERATAIAGAAGSGSGALDYLANQSHPTYTTIRELLGLSKGAEKDSGLGIRAALEDLTYHRKLAAAAVVPLYTLARALCGYLGWPDERLQDWYDAMSRVIPDSAPSASA